MHASKLNRPQVKMNHATIIRPFAIANRLECHWSSLLLSLLLYLKNDWSFLRDTFEGTLCYSLLLYIVEASKLESSLSYDIMPKSIDQDGESFGTPHDTLYLLWWSIDLSHDWAYFGVISWKLSFFKKQRRKKVNHNVYYYIRLRNHGKN